MRYMTAIIILIVLVVAWMAYGYLSIRNIEEPSYTLLESLSNGVAGVELRQYGSMITAETTVDGPYDDAINNGFRLIADYIFGNNTTQTSIAMTAPVLQEETSSTKIAMTTPVLQEQVDGDRFTIGFVMPSQYSMATIPKPNNPVVILREVPGRTLGVITFSGLWTDEKARRFTEALRSTLLENEYTPVSQPQFARYNPPWTPPWMRRNEIWIAIEQ